MLYEPSFYYFHCSGYALRAFFCLNFVFRCAYLLSSLEFKRRRLDERLLGNFLIAAMVGGIVGAKIVYLLENVTFSEFARNPIHYLLARGGITYYGGLLGAALLMWFIAHRNKMSFWTL